MILHMALDLAPTILDIDGSYHDLLQVFCEFVRACFGARDALGGEARSPTRRLHIALP